MWIYTSQKIKRWLTTEVLALIITLHSVPNGFIDRHGGPTPAGGGPKFYQGYQISFGGPTKLRITKYDYEIGLRNVPGLGEWSLDFRDPLPSGLG